MTSEPLEVKCFYLVWQPKTSIIRHRHNNLEEAIQEAARLTRKECTEFVILKAIGKTYVKEIGEIAFRD